MLVSFKHSYFYVEIGSGFNINLYGNSHHIKGEILHERQNN